MSGHDVAGRYVGQSVRRREDDRLVTGQGQFVDDVVLPGMLHGAFVRSPVARGEVRAIDTAAAERLPGVAAVLTGADLNPGLGPAWHTVAGPRAPRPPRRALADGDVRCVGEPIALVVAESRYVAEDACELVDVDIEPQPAAVGTDRAARDDAPLVHPELGTNLASAVETAEDPELEAAFASAARVVSATYDQQRYLPVPMETRGIVARWRAFGDGLTVWMSTQAPHDVRLFLSRLLGLDEGRVRVVMGDVGGAFGQKIFPLCEEIAVVAAARALGRTVKWIEDRHENLTHATSARLERMEVEAAVAADGTVTALRGRHTEDCGAYPVPASGSTAGPVRNTLPGPYRIGHLGFANQAFYTNTMGRAPYRGPWVMETFAREQLMDEVARQTGTDPLELRRRNIIDEAELPYEAASGVVYDRITPRRTLEQAAELIGYDDFRREQASRRARGEHTGIGISCLIEPTAMGRGVTGTEGALLRVEPGGGVSLHLGSASHGHSLETTMAQVAAEHLGCGIDDVTLYEGDTMSAPFGAGTMGSRSAVLYGNATREVAVRLRAKVARIAAHLLEASPDDIRVAGGQAFVVGSPGDAVTLAEVADVAYVRHDALPEGADAGLEESWRFTTSRRTWSNACHMCTVRVAPDTGEVEFLRYVVSEDCGTMINPMVVEGQIAGGVAQGVGGALYEEMVYDADGNPLTTTFLDYLLPTSPVVPTIEYGHIETPATNAGGFKGMGEGGAIGAPAAIANAVADALAPFGVAVRAGPLGPSRIIDLIEAAGAG